MMKFNFYLLLVLPLVLYACGGTTIPTDPVKEMKKKFTDKFAYTIILSDMDLQDEQYVHKYKIVELTKEGKVIITTTDWEKVTDDFFALHESNLGMEVLSKREDGKYNNLVTPPGFTLFVGDERFGFWKDPGQSADDPLTNRTDSIQPSNEDSLLLLAPDDYTAGAEPDQTPPPTHWQFFPAYAHLNSEMELNQLFITKAEYDQFIEKYLFNRPYYGEQIGKDSTRYGTYSHYMFITRPAFYQRKTAKNNFEKKFSSSSDSFYRGGGGPGK